ncbi:MAG: hypothetical protein NTW53_18445 [Burkholderiales bacterium]|nr:hypothetical protein [Burkholderiales bacterium]
MMLSKAPEKVLVGSFLQASTAGFGGKRMLEMEGLDSEGRLCRITITLTFADRFTREQRWERRYPRNLPVPEQWPFAMRVDQPVRYNLGLRRKPLAHSAVRIRVYALHGVQITAEIVVGSEVKRPLENFEDLDDLAIEFIVHRLDSPLQLPLPGTEPLPGEVLPKYPVISSDKPDLGGVPFSLLFKFQVETRPDGVDITWCITRQVLRLRFTKIKMGDCGIAWYFNPSPKLPKDGSFYNFNDLLHVRICGDIEVKVTNPVRPDEGYNTAPAFGELMNGFRARYEIGFKGKLGTADRYFADPLAAEICAQMIDAGRPAKEHPDLQRDIAGALFFRLEKVACLSQIPAAGEPFEVAKDIAPGNFDAWRNGPPSLIAEFTKLGIDLGIGFVPVIGDAVDFAEFNHALATGEDRWGREVADWEVTLMGLSAIPALGVIFPLVRKGLPLSRSMLASLIRALT